MPVPTLPGLLADIDGAPYGERVRRVALIGRDNAGDPELSALLDGLSATSDHHRHLALTGAAAARDDERLQAALTHRSPRIRAVALAQLSRRGVVPADAREVLLDGSSEDRRLLRGNIARLDRADLAEAVIDDLQRQLGDREAASLLATCGDATVRRLLPELLYAAPNVATLARRHPGPLLDHLDRELRDSPPHERDAPWGWMSAALPELAVAEPDRLVGLLEQVGPTAVLPASLAPVLGRLIRFDPARLAALVVAALREGSFIRTSFPYYGGPWLPAALRRNAGRFAHQDRVAIARALREHEDRFLAFIGRLPPADRERVFEEALDDVDRSNRIWMSDRFDVLPRGLRHTEARRILGLRAVRDSPELTLRFTAHLPFAEALDTLAAELARASAEERASGYGYLVLCARRDRSSEALSEVLARCSRLANEQDPVRLGALLALARLPAALIGDEHVAGLRAIARSVLDARDTSATTSAQLATLAVRLLADPAVPTDSRRAELALEIIDGLTGRTGALPAAGLVQQLPPAARTAVLAAIRPRLERDPDRDGYRLVRGVARGLGRRVWYDDALQEQLRQATRASDSLVAFDAIHQWLSNPRTRPDRVGQLLADDESAVTIPIVQATVVRRRQDLLDLLLGTRPLRGRFNKGTVRHVPIVAGGFGRWLPRQCAAYRDALEALIATGVPSRIAAIHTLARLPGLGRAALEPYVHSDDVPVQEAALAGLAWTDRPAETLGGLLAYAGTDRARVAVYAASRCARFVPRAALAGPLIGLLQAPEAKVTARKEAARLLGAHRPPGAVDALVAVARDRATHRDLRIAAGRSLRGALDDERSWALLTALAAGSDDEARSLLETAAVQISPRHRARYGDLVVDVARRADGQAGLAALGLLGTWARWTDAAPKAAVEAIGDLERGRAWRAGAHAVASMIADGIGWSEFTPLVSALADRVDAPEPDAGGDRDRPSRQRLDALAGLVAGMPAARRAGQHDRLTDVADRLAATGVLTPAEVDVRIAAVDWRDPTAGLEAVATRLDGHLLLVAAAAASLAGCLGRDQSIWEEARLVPAADRLLDAGTAAAAVLCLELVRAAGDRVHWPEPWRARLRRLRAHTDPDVRAFAGAVWTAPE